MAVLFTIGHSTRTWGDFLSLLRAHRVKRVIDVRSIPRSRHNPQFNRETLSKKLRAARIGYVYLPKLGGLRRTHRDSVNMGWRNTSFRGFAGYMQTSDFEAGLRPLVKLVAQKVLRSSSNDYAVAACGSVLDNPFGCLDNTVGIEGFYRAHT